LREVALKKRYLVFEDMDAAQQTAAYAENIPLLSAEGG